MERVTAPWYLPIVNHRGVVPQTLFSALEQHGWYTEPKDSFPKDGTWISIYPEDGIYVECRREGKTQTYTIFPIEDL